jgi:hypothetical protein
LIRKYHKLLQNLFQWSNGFPKDVNNFAHQVSSQNVSRRQTVFTGNRKHAGPQIMRKNADIRYIQMRWATFQPEQTDDYDDKLWIAWVNNIFAEQRNHLHWCNLSMTSVTYYKNVMFQCSLIYLSVSLTHTDDWDLKSFRRSFPVTVNTNCEW